MNKTGIQNTTLTARSRLTVPSAARGIAVIMAIVIGLSGTANISARADTAESQRLMFQFQNARMNRLIRHQPELAAFMSGAGSGALNADVTDDEGTLTFSTGVNQRFWARARGKWGDEGQRKDKYGFAAMGLHLYETPTLIVGGMIEADYLSQAGIRADRRGMGAMAGSYFLSRTANHPLFFEGRVLYGQASDGIRLSGDDQQQPETRRGLAQLRLSGQLRYGVTTLTPNVLMSYVTDDVAQTHGGLVPGNDLRRRQIKLGLDFRHTVRHMNGARFILKGGGALSRSFTHRSGVGTLAMPNQRKRDGHVNLGFSYVTHAGGNLAIDSFVDGLGARARHNYGVKARFRIKF